MVEVKFTRGRLQVLSLANMLPKLFFAVGNFFSQAITLIFLAKFNETFTLVQFVVCTL